MLNERERRVLAWIERHLTETDPDLVRLFHGGSPKISTNGPARSLLTIGLILLVLGSVAGAIPVGMFGVAISVLALWIAYAGSGGFGSPRLA